MWAKDLVDSRVWQVTPFCLVLESVQHWVTVWIILGGWRFMLPSYHSRSSIPVGPLELPWRGDFLSTWFWSCFVPVAPPPFEITLKRFFFLALFMCTTGHAWRTSSLTCFTNAKEVTYCFITRAIGLLEGARWNWMNVNRWRPRLIFFKS